MRRGGKEQRHSRKEYASWDASESTLGLVELDFVYFEIPRLVPDCLYPHREEKAGKLAGKGGVGGLFLF